jgi:hypothetical protein
VLFGAVEIVKNTQDDPLGALHEGATRGCESVDRGLTNWKRPGTAMPALISGGCVFQSLERWQDIFK